MTPISAVFEQVSVAVLLDNFLSASNDISHEEADGDYSKMKQSALVITFYVSLTLMPVKCKFGHPHHADLLIPLIVKSE